MVAVFLSYSHSTGIPFKLQSCNFKNCRIVIICKISVKFLYFTDKIHSPTKSIFFANWGFSFAAFLAI